MRLVSRKTLRNDKAHMPMPKLIWILRWLARITGLGLVALILLFAIGEGFDLRKLTLTTGLMSVAFLAAIVGMLLLWHWEVTGGLMVVLGMLLFYVINFATTGKWPSGLVLPSCFLPGILALMCWAYSRGKG